MNAREKELLLRASLDELGPGEVSRLSDLLARSEEARIELEGMKRLRSVMADAPQPSFEAFFPTRVMQRVRSEREGGRTALAEILAGQFRRAAPVALAALISLIVFNLVTGRQVFDKPLEAVLGLPSVTIEAAYDYDPTYFSVSAAETTGEG
jgi:hypothetical protein